MFIVYLFALLYFTIFSESLGRTPGTAGSSTGRYNLELFAEIRRFWSYREQLGLGAMILNIFGNIAVFIPCGYLLPRVMRRCSTPSSTLLIGFLISFVISQIVTRIIPVRKITEAAVKKCSFPQGSLKQRLLETLISNIFYSPIMTFIMVFIAYRQASAHGAKIPFGPMMLRSQVISFIASFVLIYFITPVYQKIIFERNGIEIPDHKEG